MALTTTDFTKGVDFTGINPATGGDHNNLVELAIPKDDGGSQGKGIVLVTKDSALDTPVVPDAATTVKWQRYLWIRIPHATATSQLVTLYAWSPGSVSIAVYLKWATVIVDLTTLQAEVDAIQIVANNALSTANTANAAATAANSQANVAYNTGLDAQNRVAVVEVSLTALTTRVAAVENYINGEHNRYANFQEIQNSGVDAGGSVVGNQIRILNTAVQNPAGLFTVDLATGIITVVQAGNYYFRAFATCYTNSHQLNVLTVGGLLLIRGSAIYNSAQPLNTVSIATGYNVLTAGTAIKLSHYVDTTLAVNGLGKGVASGLGAAFAGCEIWKVS